MKRLRTKAKSQMRRLGEPPPLAGNLDQASMHLALSTLALILMLSAALSRRGGAKVDPPPPAYAEYAKSEHVTILHTAKLQCKRLNIFFA